MPNLNEHAVSFTVGGERLHGMIHLPITPGPHPGVVILHGFTGQRMEAHRLFVLFSRALAEHGVASLRFDFRGSGESEGGFEDMTASREVEDARHALEFLKGRPEVDASRVGLLGLSMGGMVAALTVAEPSVKVRALCLWAPAHPQLWLERLPEGVTPAVMEGPVDASGNPVGVAFFQELMTLEPFETVRAHKGPALVVHGSADPTVPVSIGERYAKELGAPLHVVQDGLHTFESLSAQAEAHRVTLEFFLEHL